MPTDSISRRSLLVGVAGLSAVRHAAAQSSSLDIDGFVHDIRQARTETDAQHAVEDVLQRAVAQPNRVMAAIGEPQEAGIHPIYRADDLTILNVVWAPMMVLLPHNHNMWASIGIYTGREDNILWKPQHDRVAATGAASLSAKQVLGLPADAIHSVTNPIGRLTGAIHIYGGDFFAPGRSEWDAETLQERPWDLDSARGEFAKAARRYAAVPD